MSAIHPPVLNLHKSKMAASCATNMMTSSNGDIFRVTCPLCGEFTGPGEFSTQRPVTRSLDVFFDLRLNKRLSKQAWGWWLETPSWSLWRQCNEICLTQVIASCVKPHKYGFWGRRAHSQCYVSISEHWEGTNDVKRPVCNIFHISSLRKITYIYIPIFMQPLANVQYVWHHSPQKFLQ